MPGIRGLISKYLETELSKCPLQSALCNAARGIFLNWNSDLTVHFCKTLQCCHLDYEAKSVLFIGTCKALHNPIPLDPVTSALEHKLLCVSCSPSGGTVHHLQWATITVGCEKTYKQEEDWWEREGKVPFISLYLLGTEEEPLLLTAFCMKVKLLTTVWGLFRMSFFFPISSLSTPRVHPISSFSFSLPSSLLSFLVLPPLLSSAFIPLFFSNYFISLHPPQFSKYSSSYVLSSLALKIQKSYETTQHCHSNFLKAWVHGESSTNMFFLKFILFICLLWVLVAASEILDLHWGMQDFFFFSLAAGEI